MKKAFLVAFMLAPFFGIKAFSQSTTNDSKTSVQTLQVNQAAVSVIDQTPFAEPAVDGYIFNEDGSLVKAKVQQTGKKIVIKKADYDALPMEKQTFIKEDQSSFLIIE